MTWLKAERAAVAELLTAGGITGLDHVPANPVAPVALVVPGSPYLEGGDTFGEKTIRFDVWIIAGRGDNAGLSDALDDLIGTAVTTLEAEDVHVESVGQPITYQPANGAAYLAAILSTRLDVRPPSTP